MSEHPIDGMMKTTMEKIKEMVDVNTIIGEPISTADGTVIIPVSKVAYGFGSGGSEFSSKKENDKNLFGGGSGAGVTISPVAFLVVSNGDVKILNIEPCNTAAERAVQMIPSAVDKISELFKKKPKKEKFDDDDITL